MNIDSIQEQRAKNIIWNAAGDYHFVPDYAAYEKDGEPSLYFNCIIGSVHRYYNYAPIHDMLLRLGRLREANLFRGLVWLGLERCTYEHALTDRPLLTTLRTSYSQTVWDQRTSYWDQELFDRLNTAHFGAVIGHRSRLSKKEQALLADLEFDSTLTSEQIVEHMNHLMELYFHCSIPPLHDKRRFPVFPVRFRKAALHGGALITTVQSSGDTEKKKQLTLWLPALRAETRNQKLRQFLEDSFGLSLYAPEDLEKLEKKLCCGGHRYCHLHVTRGEFRHSSSADSGARTFRSAALLQEKKNIHSHQINLSRHMLSISRLTDRIRNVLQCDTGSAEEESKYGILRPDRIWQAEKLHHEKIFFRNIPFSIGNLSVDILLDASASQQNRQEQIASQGYIIAESLTRCGIPVRVCSYCTTDGCTVLHMFRDYEEPQYNDHIFQYISAGWNRDSLAIRLTGERLLASDYDHRLLIILSDCSPNDDHRLVESKGSLPFFYDYGGEHGITDTAKEVSLLRRQDVSVLAVCTGREKDLPAARRIYGNDVVWASSPERFADAVGYLIQQKLRHL